MIEKFVPDEAVDGGGESLDDGIEGERDEADEWDIVIVFAEEDALRVLRAGFSGRCFVVRGRRFDSSFNEGEEFIHGDDSIGVIVSGAVDAAEEPVGEETMLDIVRFDAGFVIAAAGEDVDILWLLSFTGLECDADIAGIGGAECCGIVCV